MARRSTAKRLPNTHTGSSVVGGSTGCLRAGWQDGLRAQWLDSWHDALMAPQHDDLTDCLVAQQHDGLTSGLTVRQLELFLLLLLLFFFRYRWLNWHIDGSKA